MEGVIRMPKNKILMNEKHIIRMCLTICGLTLKSVSERIGVKANALANQLGRPDSTMTLTSVFTLADAMGFEIVVRDKDKQYGGVEYILSERPESDSEWEKQMIKEQAEASIMRVDNKHVNELKPENSAAMLGSLK
jgi:hypothetical protein